MEPPADIRLTFAIAPEDLPRLRRLAPLAGIPATRRALNGAYYDTADLTLKRRSLALRVHREGRHYVQSLDESGPFDASDGRPEWRWAVPTSSPDLSFPELRKRLGNVDAAELTPVFSSRIKRVTRVLHPTADTSINASLDRGSIETAAGRLLPVCQIELQLAAGEPKALFDLAQSLSRTGCLRLEARSNAWRGYALVDASDAAPAAAAQRYEALELERGISAEDALAAILRRSLAHMLVNDPAALAGDTEGVHQMRVALRRLRATLSLFKSLIPEEQRAHAIHEMKWLSGCLGAARNWDIFLALAGPLGQAFPQDPDVEAVLAEAEKKRRAAYAAMRAAMASPRYTDLALRLLEGVETRAWREQRVSESSVLLLAPLKELADGLIEKRYRGARKLARRFDALDTEGRHAFRIVSKKLRYSVDSFMAIYEAKAVRRFVKRVAALQNGLGLLNDVATAEQLMGELLTSAEVDVDLRRGAGIMQGWVRRIVAENDRTLRRRVARFLKAKPFWHRPAKAKGSAGAPAAADADGPGP